MKRIVTLLILIFSIVSVPPRGFSQCPDTYYTFSTQADVTAFAAAYPNCTSLSYIDIGGTVTDLTPIAGLALREVGTLTVRNASILTSLAGLENINTVGSLYIEDNPSLLNTDGLSGLTIANRVSFLEIMPSQVSHYLP